MEKLAARVHSFSISDTELSLWFYFRSLGLKSVQIKRAEKDYYDKSLSERKDFLKAPSTYHLCKTIVMENTGYDESFANDNLRICAKFPHKNQEKLRRNKWPHGCGGIGFISPRATRS